jgi:hypothetical protein
MNADGTDKNHLRTSFPSAVQITHPARHPNQHNMAKTKLELTWIGKETRPKLEPRILQEDPSLSYHAPHRVTDNDHFDNRLIFGDNLLALKALRVSIPELRKAAWTGRW